MRRPLASVAAAALAALPAAGRATEPLDLDLVRLGAPSAQVWTGLGAAAGTPLAPGEADQLASDARKRFAILSSEMALALSSAVLQPASTTGDDGFDVSAEAAYVAVKPAPLGDPANTLAFPAQSQWPSYGPEPHGLLIPSFHVRKGLPYSLEVGGRLLWVSQSSMYAGQLEAKWALQEGFSYSPDLALRAAWTQLFGQRDWNLGTGDVDAMISKRWAVGAGASLTPYLAARFTFLNASTGAMVYGLDATGAPLSASFPTLHATFYRTTLGLRYTASRLSLAAEATHFGGNALGKTDSDYPGFKVASSFGGAGRLGFEF
jgi:hypothetical protein